MSKQDGGPAFPLEIQSTGVQRVDGMSLRDYFAAKAMQALAAEYFKFNGACFATDHLFLNLPKHAYKMADAMLKERTQ